MGFLLLCSARFPQSVKGRESCAHQAGGPAGRQEPGTSRVFQGLPRLPTPASPPRPEASRGGVGPASGDVTALAAVALKKGCSRMLCRWEAGMRHAALQVRDARRPPCRSAAPPRPRKRKWGGLWPLRLLHAPGGDAGAGVLQAHARAWHACPGKWAGARREDRGLLFRRGEKSGMITVHA